MSPSDKGLESKTCNICGRLRQKFVFTMKRWDRPWHTMIHGFTKSPMNNSQENITERNKTQKYRYLFHGSMRTVLNTQNYVKSTKQLCVSFSGRGKYASLSSEYSKKHEVLEGIVEMVPSVFWQGLRHMAWCWWKGRACTRMDIHPPSEKVLRFFFSTKSL